MENEKTKEFDVLGYRVKLATTGEDTSFSAEDIVQLVKDEAEKVMTKNPNLNKAQVATLVALKLAEDRMKIDREFKESVDDLQSSVRGAFEQIEKVEQAQSLQ